MKEKSVSKTSGVGMRIGICIAFAVLLLGFGDLPKGWTKTQSKSNVSLSLFQDGAGISTTPKPAKTLKNADFGNVPLYFIPNKGQMNEKAHFYASTPGYTLWITQEGLVFDSSRMTDAWRIPAKEKSNPGLPDRAVSCLVFKNANKSPGFLSIESTPYKVNYLKGRNQSHWLTGIPTSKAVLYQDLYKQIDLKVYGFEKQIEYDWIIKPGGNPGDIGFQYRDVKQCSVDEEGNLVIETASGKWLHKKPRAYQVINRRKVAVEAAFTQQKEDNGCGFHVGSYDREHELIIDPLILVYSGYLGGSTIEDASSVAVDGSGSLYVVGYTNSANFPTASALQGTIAGDYDAFVTKFTPDGSGLVFSTYFGGSGSDGASSVYLDGSGVIYITGATTSTNFPLLNPYQSAFGGIRDAFVSKLSANGSSLLYSTYLGGADQDSGISLGLTTSGEICVAGITLSSDFPVYNAYDSSYGGGAAELYFDLFLTKFNTSGSALVFSTYLGTSSAETCGGLAIAADGDIYVAGGTSSSSFPTKSAYQSTPGGSGDGFIARYSGTGTQEVSTYFGGNLHDSIRDITLDASGYLYVTGDTASSNFPTTTGAYQVTKPGDAFDNDIFVAKFTSISSQLAYSTYVGGPNGTSLPFAIALGPDNRAYVTGWTESANFPVVGAFQENYAGGMDAFVLAISADGSSLDLSSYLGGSGSEMGNAITVDSSGNIYAAGQTWSTNFPAYQGFQVNNAGLQDCFFSKIENIESTITLTTPNGGEDLEVGTYYDITWTNSGLIDNVKLEYSTDSGSTWVLIENSVSNTGTWPWVIPDAPSGNCLVKVSDVAAAAADSSDSVFTISPSTRSLTLTAPNGGENWDALTEHNITWTSTGSIANVKLMYSNNNGTNWFTLNSGISTPNDGSFTWSVPDTYGSQCLVRIEDADSITTDDSNAVFTIVRAPLSITLSSPNGGETWPANTYKMIQWDDTGAIAYVTIEYSIDNGSTWNTIITSIINNGYYNWYVPDTPGLNCLVKVSESGGSTTDTSDGVFTITSPTKYIVVHSPNGGETLYIDSVHTITWTCFFSASAVKIEYTTDYGNTWNTIISSTPNDGSYDWTVPDTPSSYCRVKITDIADTAADSSNTYFTIAAAPKVITVNSPNGGEDWETGTNQNITWTGTGGIDNVKIEYTTDNGTVWNTIVSSTPNDGSHSWTVPGVLSTNCRVKITDAAGTTSDTSDGTFTISAVKTVTVITPNGGESWDGLTLQNITWSGTGSIANVKIEYSTDSGSTWNTVALTTPNDGSYSWTVPDNPSGNCLVKITDAAGLASDTSDAVFTIIAVPKTINVISPNGGESWFALTAHNITWSSTGSIANVAIDYSVDSGGTWNTVTASTPNNGSYSWTVPNNPSGNCLVKITDPVSLAADTSDAVFSIASPIVIGIISPNGGENWEVGTSNNITWTSTGGSNVKIEYSTNNGSTWSTINASTSNTGSYPWTIPNTPSTNCLVRVSDTVSPSSDISDAVFTIFTNQLEYCTSSGTYQNYEWIAGVQVGALNNPTGKSKYSDFTAMTVNVTKGGSVNVSLTPGFNSSSYNEYWRIWIDYNQDGDFADTGEAVFSGSGRSLVSGSFIVPTSAGTGNTRMRVSMKYGGYPPYCGTFTYGEVEDYTVNIQ